LAGISAGNIRSMKAGTADLQAEHGLARSNGGGLNRGINLDPIANSVEQLLSYDDVAFVDCAYKTLLRRPPDAAGLANYLAVLRGGAAKMRIISALLHSREGRRSAVALPGLRDADFRYRLARVPIFRRFVRGITASEGDSPAECAARRAANMQMRFGAGETRLTDNKFTEYRNPLNLRIKGLKLKRVLILGSCWFEGFSGFIKQMNPDCECDFVLYNNCSMLPAQPPHPADEYDFMLVQIPLRSVLPAGAYYSLSYDDIAGHENMFAESKERLLQLLDGTLRWNRELSIPTFVTNFMLPQQNPLGKLLPRRDLRNFVYFMQQLNEVIDDELADNSNCFVFDVDQISANFGRKFLQDDALWSISVGGVLGNADHEHDQRRLQPPAPVGDYYQLMTGDFLYAWWSELESMYRTFRQSDSVKLVVVDLDDTLWRGVVVEDGKINQYTYEGWPMGLVEALVFLKKRGVVLAIASKNDEAKVEAIWPSIMGNRLALSDFAVRKINWRPKGENIGEIIEAVNVLPRSVVFIDDNPAERAAVQAEFPDIRVLGSELYYLRRVLLWSPETQVAAISSESSRRTTMVQAQVQREGARKRMSREEFLGSLNLVVSLFSISGVEDEHFARALELTNKSNQFNSTGKRWTVADMAKFMSTRGRLYAFNVQDKFTHYGLVGAVIVSNTGVFEQFVMSCRVIGLEVETAVISAIGRELHRNGIGEIHASIVATKENQPVRDLYSRAGFNQDGDGEFSIGTTALREPAAHITMT
jgi:FkbH-like protein